MGVHVEEYDRLTEEGCDLIAKFERECDAVFCAEAREGWPESIRRAMAAEEQVGALIELLRETIGLILPNETDYKCDYRRRYVCHQIDKIVPEVGEDE
ncbi:hypothetical protein [Brevibacillus reuszeri]|uniref:hypothetical protein n=1 Tax=Brevibacillus reuszeri TaxID=54915 RepID=UPI0013E0856B|nr:hypothetical protein [Brevibacillus reuszeri]